MTAAKRETLYQRLQAILVALGAFDTVVRNDFIEDESKGSIAMLFDGDEEPVSGLDGTNRGRADPTYPRPMRITPEVYLLTNATLASDKVGPWLSWAIKKVEHAFLTDLTLRALLYDRDPITYEGAVTGLATGRSLAGEVSIRFTLTYLDSVEDPGPNPVTEPVTEPTTEPA